MILVDTDVFIHYLRGNGKAAKILEKKDAFSMSAVTYMELVQGMRNKKELQVFRETMKLWNPHILMIDDAITSRAIFYMEEHFLGHGLKLADALIGATAAVHALPLLTGNVKHYKVIAGLVLRRFSV